MHGSEAFLSVTPFGTDLLKGWKMRVGSWSGDAG